MAQANQATQQVTFRAAREAAQEVHQYTFGQSAPDEGYCDGVASLISERFRPLVNAAEGVRFFAYLGSPEAEKAWSALRDALKEVL